jgi:hypothetical protein
MMFVIIGGWRRTTDARTAGQQTHGGMLWYIAPCLTVSHQAHVWHWRRECPTVASTYDRYAQLKTASAHVIVASFQRRVSIPLRAYRLWSKMFFVTLTKECTKLPLISRGGTMVIECE